MKIEITNLKKVIKGTIVLMILIIHFLVAGSTAYAGRMDVARLC